MGFAERLRSLRGVVPDGTQERIDELRRRRASLEARLKRSEGHFSAAEAMAALSRIGELSSAREACEKAVAHAVTVRSEGAVVVTIGSPDDTEGRCSSIDAVGGTMRDKANIRGWKWLPDGSLVCSAKYER